MKNWFATHSAEEEKLYASRPKKHKSDALSPCDMTPDDVDYEMAQGKHATALEICGMNQESLEYFVEKYGEAYERLSFFKCQLISDLSPLSRLKNLKSVSIYWNIRAEALWDMSENTALEAIAVMDAKKLTKNGLPLLETGKTLKMVGINGSIFEKYPFPGLSVFQNLTALEELRLYDLKFADKSLDALKTLPNLQTFDFDAGMFTTEEIAYMCARYPQIEGTFMGPYGPQYPGSESYMRISGYRKPTLEIPAQQKALDKHIAHFHALIEKYKTEEL